LPFPGRLVVRYCASLWREFSGSDATATIKAFEKLKLKNEFETTAIYKARHAK
jgi:hypothetical protein